MKRLLLLTIIVASTTLSATTNKDWAQFYRYEGKNDSLAYAPKVVLMGNSITDCWPDAHPDFFVENQLLGRGISGQVSSQMLVRFQEDVIDLHPSVVVILCGTNDIAENNGPITHEHILQNIKSMCDLARFHGIKPVVCSTLPANRFKWRPDLQPAKAIVRLNEMIKAYAQAEGIPYVDYYSALVDETGGLPEKYSKDGVHPNPDGYSVMEGVLMEVLKEIAY